MHLFRRRNSSDPRSLTRLRRGWATALGACAVVAVAALAVTGPGFGSSNANVAAASATVAKLSGAPVKVMTIASVNYNGPNFKNIHEAARVYAAWINARGGINGRPLAVTNCDDKGDPTLGVACARQAIAKKMVAVIGSFTFSGAQIVPVLEKAKIPWFGVCCPVSAPEFSSKISFPLASGLGVVAGQAYVAGKTCKKINLLDLDYPGADFIELLTKNVLASLGASEKFGIHVKIPLQVGGDLGPAAAQVTGGGADCVTSGLAEANWAAFIPALQQSGVKNVKFFGSQGNLDTKVTSPFPGLTSGWVVAGMYPDLALPQWQDFRAALKKYKADTKQDYNSLGGLGTWAAYVAFTKIAKNMKSLNNVSFFNAANKTSNLTTGGLTPKIDFTKEWTDGLPGSTGSSTATSRSRRSRAARSLPT